MLIDRYNSRSAVIEVRNKMRLFSSSARVRREKLLLEKLGSFVLRKNFFLLADWAEERTPARTPIGVRTESTRFNPLGLNPLDLIQLLQPRTRKWAADDRTALWIATGSAEVALICHQLIRCGAAPLIAFQLVNYSNQLAAIQLLARYWLRYYWVLFSIFHCKITWQLRDFVVPLKRLLAIERAAFTKPFFWSFAWSLSVAKDHSNLLNCCSNNLSMLNILVNILVNRVTRSLVSLFQSSLTKCISPSLWRPWLYTAF